MNTKELAKLTDEQKRIRIAELCGWTQLGNGEWKCNIPSSTGLWQAEDAIYYNCPDYLNDLNAMHEAEKTMTDFQLQTFGEHLQEIVNYYCVGVVPDYRRHLMCLAKIAHASAAQRADAFLLTLG